MGRRLNETPEAMRPCKVIFVITTDGLENASREFGYDEVKKMITHQSEKYGWEFIFMGANIDAVCEGERLGIDKDRSFNFATSSDGVSEMYCKINALCSSVRTARPKGKKAVKV